jgi:predicted patatin/cPLA2 family phospholipase
VKTQQQRIFEFLAKGPSTPKDIAKALNMTVRQVHCVGNKNCDIIKKETTTTWSLKKEIPRIKRLKEFHPLIKKLREKDASWREIQVVLEGLGHKASINTIFMNYDRNSKKDNEIE